MLPKEEVLKAALEDNASSRRAFMAKHGTHAGRVANKLALFYAEFGDAVAGWPKSPRCATVSEFIHMAGNSLVQSLNLLVVSMGAASGNLMRQYAEAVAMTLLCSTEETGVLERYLADRKGYPIHKAVDRLLQDKTAKVLQAKVGFDAAGWTRFKKMVSLFDHHSHSGIISLGFHVRFGKKAGGLVVGTEYDPHKFAVYRRELKFRAVAAGHLRNLLGGLDPAMRSSA